MDGYFVPPVMFSVPETISLLLGLTHIRSLRARPFAAELDTATQKLLAALPAHLRQTLAEAQRVIAFEGPPATLSIWNCPSPLLIQTSSATPEPRARWSGSSCRPLWSGGQCASTIVRPTVGPPRS